MTSGAQKRKEKAQRHFQSSAKFRKLTEVFAASSPRLTTI